MAKLDEEKFRIIIPGEDDKAPKSEEELKFDAIRQEAANFMAEHSGLINYDGPKISCGIIQAYEYAQRYPLFEILPLLPNDILDDKQFMYRVLKTHTNNLYPIIAYTGEKLRNDPEFVANCLQYDSVSAVPYIGHELRGDVEFYKGAMMIFSKRPNALKTLLMSANENVRQNMDIALFIVTHTHYDSACFPQELFRNYDFTIRAMHLDPHFFNLISARTDLKDIDREALISYINVLATNENYTFFPLNDRLLNEGIKQDKKYFKWLVTVIEMLEDCKGYQKWGIKTLRKRAVKYCDLAMQKIEKEKLAGKYRSSLLNEDERESK